MINETITRQPIDNNYRERSRLRPLQEEAKVKLDRPFKHLYFHHPTKREGYAAVYAGSDSTLLRTITTNNTVVFLSPLWKISADSPQVCIIRPVLFAILDTCVSMLEYSRRKRACSVLRWN